MIAASNYEEQKLQLEIELNTLVENYLSNQNVLNYYQASALPQANVMIKFSQKSYAAGESGYVEFIQNVTEALQIQLKYLDAINNYNQNLIDLEYLMGEF